MEGEREKCRGSNYHRHHLCKNFNNDGGRNQRGTTAKGKNKTKKKLQPKNQKNPGVGNSKPRGSCL